MIQYTQAGCPMCEYLKSKQDETGVPYTIETNKRKMLSLGIVHVPMLKVDDEEAGVLNYAEALKFIASGGCVRACNQV